jgi:DNA-binding protein YbaB
LKIVPPGRKDEVLTQMREMEDKLREMEKELHNLYVQQIRRGVDTVTVSE